MTTKRMTIAIKAAITCLAFVLASQGSTAFAQEAPRKVHQPKAAHPIIQGVGPLATCAIGAMGGGIVGGGVLSIATGSGAALEAYFMGLLAGLPFGCALGGGAGAWALAGGQGNILASIGGSALGVGLGVGVGVLGHHLRRKDLISTHVSDGMMWTGLSIGLVGVVAGGLLGNYLTDDSQTSLSLIPVVTPEKKSIQVGFEF